MDIQVRNLTKYYGSQAAVDDISFTINPGEIVGFLGPNGAGKSTTMKMLTGFVPPTTGEAHVAGFNVSENAINVKENVGYLPESNPLYYDMYVREFLLFIAHTHKLNKPNHKVEEVIYTCGLEQEAHKIINSLSKGYKQRVGLAQAIIHDPSVLILDEPTSGLDINQLQEIRALIKALGKEKTILFSSHIMQEIEALCNRVLIIKEGKIIADNYLQKVKESGKRKIIKLSLQNQTKNKEAYLHSGIRLENGIGADYYFSSQKEVDIRPELFAQAVKNGDVIIGMEVVEDSIETVFQNLTK